MRIKLDENLPHSLAAELSALGHDVDTVPQEGLRGQADAAIWSAAQLSERFLITQDLDFPISDNLSLELTTACCWLRHA